MTGLGQELCIDIHKFGTHNMNEAVKRLDQVWSLILHMNAGLLTALSRGVYPRLKP